ncbi:MAG: hypothetical protein WDO70_05650 [Alphaproteobacteria bacterium]
MTTEILIAAVVALFIVVLIFVRPGEAVDERQKDTSSDETERGLLSVDIINSSIQQEENARAASAEANAETPKSSQPAVAAAASAPTTPATPGAPSAPDGSAAPPAAAAPAAAAASAAVSAPATEKTEPPQENAQSAAAQQSSQQSPQTVAPEAPSTPQTMSDFKKRRSQDGQFSDVNNTALFDGKGSYYDHKSAGKPQARGDNGQYSSDSSASGGIFVIGGQQQGGSGKNESSYEKLSRDLSEKRKMEEETSAREGHKNQLMQQRAYVIKQINSGNPDNINTSVIKGLNEALGLDGNNTEDY